MGEVIEVQAPASGQCPKCNTDVLLVHIDYRPYLIEIVEVPVVKLDQKPWAAKLTGRVVQGHLPHICPDLST